MKCNVVRMKKRKANSDVFLDLSNHHVSLATSFWLRQQGLRAAQVESDADPFPAITLGATPYGWFIYVPTVEKLQAPDIPPDLKAVLEYAHAKGFSYLLFDRDAELIEELPTFDW